MKKTIAIFVGGPSSERDVSLASRDSVFAALAESGRYEPLVVEMTQDKNFIIGNEEHGQLTRDIVSSWDAVLNLMYGTYGEDGEAQKLFDALGLPYTGSNAIVSAMAMNKDRTGQVVEAAVDTLHVPKSHVCEEHGVVHEHKFSYPLFIKPNASGSSCGISLVERPEELPAAFAKAQKEHQHVLVQECIHGREFTCGVIGNGDNLEALPVAEIIKPESHQFFDYDAKYHAEETQEVCPVDIPMDLAERIQKSAVDTHRTLGCRGLTRSDFIYQDDKLYFLEINTLPGMAPVSICPKEARAAGFTPTEFLEKICDLAFE